MSEIAAVEREELGEILPLLAAYQRFYGVAEPDDGRNAAFLERFCGDGATAGVLLAARGGGAACGFACVYWTQDSISARDIALLHDLYVDEPHRGTGVGRDLLAAAAGAARERGLKTLSWSTAPENHTAQRLYDSLGAERSTWFEYTLDLT